MPVASEKEAASSFPSIKGEVMAQSMTLEDVKRLYKIHESGKAYLTAVEWYAMLTVILRDLPKNEKGQVLLGEFADMYIPAKASLRALSYAT